MSATAQAGCWFPSKVWRAVLCFLEFFENTSPALMVQAWVLVYQHVWKWHLAVLVIIFLYFLSFDFSLEFLVLKMSHRKQKLRFSTKKKKPVEFYFLGLSFAGSSYFTRTLWASYSTLRCWGLAWDPHHGFLQPLLGTRAVGQWLLGWVLHFAGVDKQLYLKSHSFRIRDVENLLLSCVTSIWN